MSAGRYADRAGPIIDAVVVDDAAPRPVPHLPAARSLAGLKAPARQRMVVAHLLWVVGVVALAIVVVIAFRMPIARAFADLAGLRSGFEALEFRAVRTESRRARSGRTLVVHGEVVNRSDREVALPAISLRLRADGAELLAWSVVPIAASLAPGQAIGFRSAVVQPGPRDGEIALSFADRETRASGL